ncbi:FAST kinase domain-containing protein 1, mitochondrial-like [Centruroides vittatus]|uniref:FAST kinase domain-containing protein 1, mitochondrial-like n=1 Tax=Centruroides vittatus TaxID=120091 RepID=UPI00350EDABC
MLRQVLCRSIAKYKIIEKSLRTQQSLQLHRTTQCLRCSEIQETDPFAIADVPSKEVQRDLDILEEKLRRSKNFDAVFDLISTHSDIMNNKHLSLAFSSLYDCSKEQSNTKPFNPFEDKLFLQLCTQTMKRIKHFTIDEVITIYKTLSFFNIPSTTAIMKSLGQMLRHNINELSLGQINFLILLLERQQQTPLVEALLIALPLVLQSQLELQMDPENVSEMISCLKTLTKNKINNSSIEKLTSMLLQKVNTLSTRDAYLIFTCLANTQYRCNETNEELLYKSLDILSQNVEELSDRAISTVLNLMKEYKLFNKCLIESLVTKAINEQWDLWKLSSLIYLCSKNEFIPLEMLDFVANMIKMHPKEVELDQRISLLTVLEPFALVGYESPEIVQCCKIISSCKEKLNLFQKNSISLFVKINSHLAQLKCHPSSSFFSENVFSSILRNNIINKGNTKTLYVARAESQLAITSAELKINFAQELCVIEWATKLCFDNYDGPYLPNDIFQEVMNRVWKEKLKTNFKLDSFLKHGLGGEQFFQINVMTKYGHGIDYLLVMRKGGYPIAIRNLEATEDEEIKQRTEITFVEDLQIPLDSKIITIIVADDLCFCKNSGHLKGWMKLQLQTLGKLGYLPLMINLRNWESLQDHEKIPYLMREIQEIVKNSELEKDVYPAM